MEHRICPSCGRTIEAAEARFCLNCGGALPDVPAEAAGSAAALEAEIRDGYRGYAAWAEQFLAGEGAGRKLLSLFTSSPFKTSEEHKKFFEGVKALTLRLLPLYQADPAAGDAAALLRFALVDCHSLARREADWMFLAAEQLWLPFLPLLTAAEAAALYPDYQALRKKQQSFPFQAEILKTLDKMREF